MTALAPTLEAFFVERLMAQRLHTRWPPIATPSASY